MFLIDMLELKTFTHGTLLFLIESHLPRQCSISSAASLAVLIDFIGFIHSVEYLCFGRLHIVVLGGGTGPLLVDSMCGLEYDPRALQGSQHIAWCGLSKIQTKVKKLALSHELWFREYRAQGGGLVSDLFDSWHHMILELGRVHPVRPPEHWIGPGNPQNFKNWTALCPQVLVPCVQSLVGLSENHQLSLLKLHHIMNYM